MSSYFKNYISLLVIVFSIQVNAQKLLTKDAALQLALENNYGIKVAKNNTEIAKNNSNIYNSGFLPILFTNVGANYNNSNQEIETQNGTVTIVNGAETKSYNASVNLNYTIFDGLGRKYNYKQLKEVYNLTELQARETIENMYLQLFSVYFQIARLSENTQNLQQTLEVSKHRLQRANYQYDYGQSTKLELLNAEVDVNNDSINLINVRQQFINAKRDLSIVIGVKQNINYTVETEIDFNVILPYEELLLKAQENNVFLNQSDKNISISKYIIKANKSGYLPSIDFSTSYGWNKSENPDTSFLINSKTNGLNTGINLSWNAFDGGITKTRVANAKIDLENQEILKEQQVEAIETILKNTWEDYQNKLFIYRAQIQNVITNQNNFDRTEERYNLGQVTSIEFRLAQVNLLNTKTALNNAKYDAKFTELELLQICGLILDVDF